MLFLSALPGISIFFKKKKPQKQVRQTSAKQEYEKPHCWSIYTLPFPQPNHRVSDDLVIVYQRELFAGIVGIQPQFSLRTLTRVRVAAFLKCKCARTPGRPPRPQESAPSRRRWRGWRGMLRRGPRPRPAALLTLSPSPHD